MVYLHVILWYFMRLSIVCVYFCVSLLSGYDQTALQWVEATRFFFLAFRLFHFIFIYLYRYIYSIPPMFLPQLYPHNSWQSNLYLSLKQTLLIFADLCSTVWVNWRVSCMTFIENYYWCVLCNQVLGFSGMYFFNRKVISGIILCT